MFVLITYDVNITYESGAKRLRNVAKACVDYGKRVQNSVFECVLTDAQFLMLKNRLKNIIDSKQDSVRFYMLGKNWKKNIETIGKDNGVDVTGDLIIKLYRTFLYSKVRTHSVALNCNRFAMFEFQIISYSGT